MERCQNEASARRRELLRCHGDAKGRVEACFEARRELLEVACDAGLGRTAPGILQVQANGAGEQEAFDSVHRRDERRAL